MQPALRAEPASKRKRSVFLNVPYAAPFGPQFLAYICGICSFGLLPRVTLEISGGTHRLDKIIGLIEECEYAIHDLSWVELDNTPPSTPRFNMPFELGLSVLHAKRSPGTHTWFHFEAMPYRVQKSLSDLNGIDPYIHDGSVEGIFRELAKAFVREEQQPTVTRMKSIYNRLVPVIPVILTDVAASDPFNARAFHDIVITTIGFIES